jgi:hypothetical protein
MGSQAPKKKNAGKVPFRIQGKPAVWVQRLRYLSLLYANRYGFVKRNICKNSGARGNGCGRQRRVSEDWS